MFDCTVIIPSHNALRYLKEAVATVRMQSFDHINLEIIVVDDGSTDGTFDWLKYQQDIVTIRTEGVGVSAARNLAINRASSPLIAFLDADDLWWAGKLSEQIAFHDKHPQASFSFTDYIHFNEQGRLLGTCFEFWQSRVLKQPNGYQIFSDAENEILALNIVGTSTVMARKDALLKVGGYRNDLHSAEDWDLWLKLAKVGEVGVTNAVKTSYLMRAGSITADKSKRIAAITDVVTPYQGMDGYKEAIARLNIAKAEQYRVSGQYRKAMRHHFQAFTTLKNKRVLKATLSDLIKSVRV